MSDRLSEIRKRLDASPFVDDAWDEDMRWLIEQYERLNDDSEFLRLTVREQSTVQQRHETGMDVRRDALTVEVTALRSKLAEVREAIAATDLESGESLQADLAHRVLAILDRDGRSWEPCGRGPCWKESGHGGPCLPGPAILDREETGQ